MKKSRARALWLAVYGLLCAAEFVIDTLKEWVSKRVKDGPPKKEGT